MNHHGEPGRPEQGYEPRANLGSAQVDRLLAPTVGSHREIPEIPEMRPLWVPVAMAEARGIEMGSGGLETRRFALAHGMDVEPVLSRSEPCHPHLHLEPLVPLLQRHATHVGAQGIAKNRFNRGGGSRAASAAAAEDSRQRHDYDITHLEFLHMNC